MSLSLHTIKPSPSSKKSKRRVGRGGKRGTYSGKGLKGQKSRSGASGLKRRGIRQLMESTPKLRGFKSLRKKPEVVNLIDLNKKFQDGDKITPKTLLLKGLVTKTKNGVKILGNGNIKIKLEISKCQISASAKEKIEKAGGSITENTKSQKTQKQ